MKRLRPFFSFFGAKWLLAPHYPSPQHDTIVEPFAGSAGYSVCHADRKVILFEKDPVIAGVWDYLIRSSAAEIRSLPEMPEDGSVNDLAIPQEARWFIGFWLNKAHPTPCITRSAWARRPEYAYQFWCAERRDRIAAQVASIKHWKIINDSYQNVPNRLATWFVDPPYAAAGTGGRYRCGFSEIDYEHLGLWCRRRRGQVIVCENTGANWLPFRTWKIAKATGGARRAGISSEAIWERGDA